MVVSRSYKALHLPFNIPVSSTVDNIDNVQWFFEKLITSHIIFFSSLALTWNLKEKSLECVIMGEQLWSAQLTNPLRYVSRNVSTVLNSCL